MAILKKGDKVKMKYGGEATVLDEFGSGGQGTVYRVSFQDKEWALKWYHKDVFKGEEQAFYRNLENNIARGAPTDAFLWPQGITEVCGGQYGYIMAIRPRGYYELTEFFVGSTRQKQVRFHSFSAIADAAIQIIQAFRELHNSGYSYQDINNGNFFINPADGKVLICDNDNVSPYGINLGILGKQRYMAPEIVQRLNDPDKMSDRFSLAVVLFRLLFINHPLEGRYSTPPCMTKELERKYYGIDPVFVYDATEKKNAPIPGTDHNLKLFWSIYPNYIKEAFVRAFSKEVMKKEKPRIIEKEWLDLFFRLKAGIVKCPHCGNETFIEHIGDSKCMECHRTLLVQHGIAYRSTTLPLFTGTKIMLWHVDASLDDVHTQIGEVIPNKNDATLLGIRNISNITWKVNLPDNTQRNLPPGGVVPVKSGFILECTSNPADSGKII